MKPFARCFILPWPNISGDVYGEPPAPPPIVGQIVRHRWQLPRLLKRDVPE
jgi:hypothetical protein